jgi:hypothetical protein
VIPLARFAGAVLAAALLCTTSAQAQDAAALRARHGALREQLAGNVFQRALVLESVQNANDLKGDVYAVIDQPFEVLSPALQGREHWCELLILHLNVKHCSSTGKAGAEVLSLVVGRKFDQPLEDAYRVDFDFNMPSIAPDYLRVQMSADTGPLSTRNYRLALEAVPLDAKRSFVHMSYSYAYGMAARMAMQGYLATVGRDKVGFSIVGKGEDGKPLYIDGVRGVVERNTMRYFLAIEAYLGAMDAPAAEQVEKRLRDWYSAVDRYPRQLHELERNEYLEMKRREVQRQRGAAPR